MRAAGEEGSASRSDVRLVVPAAVTWAGAAIGGRLSVSTALVTAGLLTVVAAAVAIRRTTLARVACVASVCAAAGVSVAAVRAPTATAGPLSTAARQHQSISAVVVVTGDPQIVQPRSAAGRRLGSLVLVRASARRVQVGRQTIVTRTPVLIIAHGAAWGALLPSQRLTAAGATAPPQSGDAVALALFARGPPTEVGPPSLLQRLAGRVRAGLRAAADPLPADERGLLPGLVDGDVSRLSDRVRDEFRTTGLTHLVAVSGANVAIVAAAALGLARALRLGLRSRAWVAGAAVVAFVVLARPSPSVLRAAVMGVVGLAALATGRRRAGLPALAAAVLSLVLIAPSLATSDGFVLSVLATGGLLLVAPWLRDRFRRVLPQWAAESLAVAVAAQLMTTPYIAVRFARVSLLSVPANLLAVAAVPPATVLGVIAAAIAPVSLPVAKIVAALAFLPTAWLIEVARTGSAVPGAAIGWPGGWAGGWLLLGTAAVCLLVGRLLGRRVSRWFGDGPSRGSPSDAGRR